MTQPEKAIENQILDWLNTVPLCFAWKHHANGARKKTFRNATKYCPSGIPDIVGLYKGVFFAIEVKSKTGKVSEVQLKMIEKILGCRGVAFIADSLEKAQSCFYFHFNVENRTDCIVGERPIFED